MNDPLIDPWTVYWLTRLDALNVITCLLTALGVIGFGVTTFCVIDQTGGSKWEMLAKRYRRLFVVLAIVFWPLAVLTPTTDQGLMIVVANEVTAARVEKLGSVTTDVYEKLKSDIIDIVNPSTSSKKE